MPNLGKWIRQLRTEQGLEIKQFATQTGVDASSISRVELERTQPQLHTFVRLWQGLGLTLVDLIEKFQVDNPAVKLDIYPSLTSSAFVLSVEDVKAFVEFFKTDEDKGRDLFIFLLNKIDERKRALQFYYESVDDIQLPDFGDDNLEHCITNLPMESCIIHYPSQIDAKLLLQFYQEGGIITLAEAGRYLNAARLNQEMSLVKLQKKVGLSDSALSRLETASLGLIRFPDILKLSEILKDYKILGLYWQCAQLRTQVIHRRTKGITNAPPENWTQGDFNVAEVMITLARWLQVLNPENTDWLNELRDKIKE